MCGIAGIIGAPDRDNSAARLDTILGRLAHRGPHGRGVARVSGGYLGHCALPLVRDAPPQPHRRPDGPITVTFNGELYNAEELHRLLPERRAEPMSDTELLASLIETHGPEVVASFRGMYAFAAWDERDGSTLLARDRLGKKPLYYTDSDSAVSADGHPPLTFASELDALLAARPDMHRLDVHQVSTYLMTRSVAAPVTMVTGVSKLSPGETIRIGPVSSGFTLDMVRPAPGPSADVDTSLRARLESAVRHRMETDDPVGVLFSGGVDSTAVAALAAIVAGRPIPAFGVATSPEEAFWIRRTAESAGVTPHVWRPSTEEIADEALLALEHLDEPLADPSLIVTRLAARLASQHTEIVLTGDGADELFFGYRYFEAQSAFHRLRRMPPPLLRAGLRALGTRPARHLGLPLSRHANDLAVCVGLPPERGFTASHAGASARRLRRVLHPDLTAPAPHAPSDPAAPDLDDALMRSRDAIFRQFLVDLVIPKVDRATMAYGVEARSPFLDDDVVSLGMASTPSECRAAGVGKSPVRRLVDDLVGEHFGARTKLGFRAPLHRVLAGPLAGFVRTRLGDGALVGSRLWDGAAVERLIREHEEGRRDRSQLIWSLLVMECWLRRHPQITSGL